MNPRGNNRRRQRGLALLVMVVVLIVGSTYILLKQLNSSAQRINSTAASANVLAQAKEALIGYAATNSGRPGALPCPDRYPPGDANEGRGGSSAYGLGSCPNAGDRIGRLPWKTLGLPDLRDASGERLWYALSENFRDATGRVVNSDTPGTLVLNGVAAPGSPCSATSIPPCTATSLANSIVAIVFASGAALSGQSRNPGAPASLTSVANYLDGANADVANDSVFETKLSSDTFNDALLPITQANLFVAVETYVAKRLDESAVGNVKPFLNSFVAQWGAYPFAAPFTTPSATENDYKGAANTTHGLLPIARDPAVLTWRIPAASEQLVVKTGYVSGAGLVDGTVTSDCSSTTDTVFRCSITYTRVGSSGAFQPYIQVTPTLKNVGMGFLDYDQINVGSSDIAITTLAGGGVTYGSTSTTYQRPAWSSNTLRTDAGADMLFANGRLRSTSAISGTRTIILKITWSQSTSQYLTRPTSPSTPNTDWFFDNQWYRLTYYSISSGYAPGQAASCVAGGSPLCLSVNNLASPNTKYAVLVLAGSAAHKSDGSDQTRPSGALADYFEGQNLTPADWIFESNVRSTTFNDKPVVLAP